MSVEQAGRELERSVAAKRAGIGQALGKYNAEVKKRRQKYSDRELKEITRHHVDRVMSNRTYH